MRGNVSKCHNGTIFGNCVYLLSGLQHLVERDSRDIKSLVQPIVVQIIVCAAFAHVRAHSDRMQHKVDFAAQQFLCLYKDVFQVFVAGGICCHNRSVNLLRKRV